VSVDSSSALVAKAVEQEQRATAIMAQLQLADAASAQYGANAKNTAAELAATADRMRTVQSEIDNARSEFGSLSTNVRDLMSSVPQVIEELRRKADQSHADTEAALALLRTKLENSIQELTASSQGRLESAANALQSQSADTDSAVKLLIANTNDRLTQAETGHASRIDTEVSAFSQRVESLLGSLREQTNSELSDSKAKSDAMIADSSAEMRRLTSELAKLEEGIRASIERATGFSLFHSFQKRQLDIELAKRFWMYALAGTVVVSLCISAVFIWSLQFVTQYNAAFFLKLSISLPLVYAIAFCSIQYGRERRLEEEYAFKSSISISLDPYQRLVGQLVDRQKPEELAKYTAFVIESVGKVFTSPTDRIFDDQSGDKNTAEKIIKAVGDVIEPIVKAVRK